MGILEERATFVPRDVGFDAAKSRDLSSQVASPLAGAKPEGGLNLNDVLPASLIPLGVVAELRRIKIQLLRDEGAQRSRRLLSLLEDPPGKSQVAEHEGEAQTVRVTATSID